jgi:dihydrofolate reductase
MNLTLVAAMTPSRVIGLNGGIPWHLPEDMKHFRAVTTGHPIIMGRKTFDSIGKPLPKRRNIVISRDASLKIEGTEVVGDLLSALNLTREESPRIIGGAQIYALAMPIATEMILTLLKAEHEGDTFFPKWDAGEWTQVASTETEAAHYITYQRT